MKVGSLHYAPHSGLRHKEPVAPMPIENGWEKPAPEYRALLASMVA